MTPSVVLFDIDGTLVDSNYLHVEAWTHAFAQLGVPVDAWRIHRGIGMDSELLLKELLGADAETIGSQASELHARYYEGASDRLRAFDGGRELLRALTARERVVVLATSAPESELAKLRATLDIEDELDVVTSADDVESAKPAPDVVSVAVERSGVPASDAVMVGDTVWDVIAARSAGVACIGVLSGGVSAAELLDAGAIAVYADVRDLLDHVDESPLA